MKFPSSTGLWLALVAASAALLAGCGGAPKSNVNVTAEVQNLKSDNADTRQQAAIKLAEAKEAAAGAVDPLVAALKDQDALVRRLAAYALGEIGPKAKAALPALKESMNDPDVSVIQAAVNAIRAIDPKAPIDAKLPPNVTN